MITNMVCLFIMCCASFTLGFLFRGWLQYTGQENERE